MFTKKILASKLPNEPTSVKFPQSLKGIIKQTNPNRLLELLEIKCNETTSVIDRDTNGELTICKHTVLFLQKETSFLITNWVKQTSAQTERLTNNSCTTTKEKRGVRKFLTPL